MELLKLVIVDDEPILLQGLLDTYDWESMGFEVVGSAKSGVQALEVIRREQPHVVLTDIWSYVKKKYKLNVPNFHVPAGQVSLQEPQQILPLLSDILLRTD